LDEGDIPGDPGAVKCGHGHHAAQHAARGAGSDTDTTIDRCIER
jgi:hypothetical protein